jgi:hypothetical protein
MMDNGCIYGEGTCEYSRALELEFKDFPDARNNNTGEVSTVWEYRGLLSDWMGLARQLGSLDGQVVGNTVVHFARDWVSEEAVGVTVEVFGRGSGVEETVFQLESRLPSAGIGDYGWYQANRWDIFE